MSSQYQSREERLKSSVFTGSQLTDMRVLAQADDKTFHTLCQTNLRLYDICTNHRLEQHLYEMRVQIRFTKYYPMLGLNKKLVKLTWKEIYKILVKMEKEELLDLLTITEPITYSEEYDPTEPWEMYLPILIMGRYPDIFKFVYLINPVVFADLQPYLNTNDRNNRISQRNWREIVDVLTWLLDLSCQESRPSGTDQNQLDLNKVELKSKLIRYSLQIGYGPFIRDLINRKIFIPTLGDVITALARGAGDIGVGDTMDPLSPPWGEDDYQSTKERGMINALQMGNVEGLEAFHQMGLRFVDDVKVSAPSYQYIEKTTKWLLDHGYMIDDINIWL